MTDTFVTAPVRTIAGQQDVSQQLLDQSPIAFDEMIYSDLLSSYNQQLDLQVISGTGANGQLQGLLPLAAAPGLVTYTSASPTWEGVFTGISQVLSAVARTRFAAADAIVMTPSRWYWFASQLDGANRPLVTPEGADGRNTIAVYDAAAAEGQVGAMFGIPVFTDANIPTNLGAGTNQDTILACRFDDSWLYEGAVRTRALGAPLSGTLQVRIQLWNYAAIGTRHLQSLGSLQGTGMVVPAGY